MLTKPNFKIPQKPFMIISFTFKYSEQDIKRHVSPRPNFNIFRDSQAKKPAPYGTGNWIVRRQW